MGPVLEYAAAKPLIIHAIANFMLGGSSRLVMDLVEHLADQYSHEVITRLAPDPPVHTGVRVHEYVWDSPIEQIVEHFKKTNPILIHVHYWGANDAFWYEKIFRAAEMAQIGVVENINTPVAPHVSPQVLRYVYVSRFVWETFGHQDQRGVVVYPGSDFALFRRNPDREFAEQCIGMVYRLETDKLDEASIEPFIRVVQRRPTTQVLIVGGGSLLAVFQAAVRQAGVERNFTFTGYVSYKELPALYEKMSIFVAPVWQESFGQVSPFAMIQSLPVVGYAVGALPEIIANADLLAPPGHAEKLADIILGLLDDQARRIAIGKQNCERAERLFALPAMLAAYDKIYAQAISDDLMRHIPVFAAPQGKRIAFFVHCFFPDHFHGTETYTLNLAQQVKHMGYEPVVVTAVFDGEPRRDRLVTYYEYEGIPVVCLDKNRSPVGNLHDTYDQATLLDVYCSLLQHVRPDIVHVTHLVNHTGALLRACRKLNVPTVATFTDFYAICLNGKLQTTDGTLCTGPDKWRTNCLRCMYGEYNKQGRTGSIAVDSAMMLQDPGMARALRNKLGLLPRRQRQDHEELFAVIRRPDILAECYTGVRAAIVPTTFTQKIYERNGPHIPLQLIHFGVDTIAKEPVNRDAGGPIRLGYIGQLDYHKGVDLLIEAFRRLPDGVASLHIYGAEEQAPEYSRQLRQQAFGHAVSFCGTFPSADLPEVMATLDFLVIPSRWYENSPLILLSALACHTPVIISNVEGMTEFVQAGVNSFIFAMNDVAALENILRHIAQNPALAQTMAAQTAYERDYMQMARDTVAIYEKYC